MRSLLPHPQRGLTTHCSRVKTDHQLHSESPGSLRQDQDQLRGGGGTRISLDRYERHVEERKVIQVRKSNTG